MLFYLRTL